MKSLNNLTEIEYQILFDALYAITVNKDECNDYLSEQVQALTDEEFENITIHLRQMIHSKMNREIY